MKSLSDVVNDSEDCSGVISSTPITEVFTVLPREWLFGIWTNVNCPSITGDLRKLMSLATYCISLC